MPSAQRPPSLTPSSSDQSFSPILPMDPINTDDGDARSSSTAPTNASSSRNTSTNVSDREKPRLTEQEKKNNHIASEQKRRAAIREGFDRLTELVPGLEGQGRSESIVLKKTVDFIHLQLEARDGLISEIERESGRLDNNFRRS